MGKKSKAQYERMKQQHQKERREERERQKKQQQKMLFITCGIAAAVLIVLAVVLAIALGGEKKPVITKLQGYTNEAEVTDYVRMNVSYTDKSGTKRTQDIVVKLRPDVAPITVKNFQDLVADGFYDGLTFHRVVSGFMIQGGDPKGNGNGSSTPITGEMTNNGHQNDLLHERGVISMARRSGDYDSGSCQFFIVHETTQNNHDSLDGEYAAFGQVVTGMDTVDGIAGTAVTYQSSTNYERSKPINPVTINYMIFVSPETAD